VLTGFRSTDKASTVVRDLKAFWFLEKPVQPGVLRELLERAIIQNGLIEETGRLNRQLRYSGMLGDLVGLSGDPLTVPPETIARLRGTFSLVICESGEYFVPARSRLYIGQSPSAGRALFCARSAPHTNNAAMKAIAICFIVALRRSA
jgi:hypothetical protein